MNPFTWSDYLFIKEKYQFYLCSLIFLLIFLTFVLNPWLVFKLWTIWQSDSEAVDKFLFNGLFQNMCFWDNTSRKLSWILSTKVLKSEVLGSNSYSVMLCHSGRTFFFNRIHLFSALFNISWFLTQFSFLK